MKRIRRCLLLVLGVALVAAVARGEDPARIARVGIISLGGPTDTSLIDALRQGLADEGYAEGRNLVIEARYADGDSKRLPALIAELLALPVDVLFTPGSQTTLAAKRQTTTVPIVFQASDPVGVGLVTSLAHPGGNLTGVSLLAGEYSRKWLELLKEAVPKIHRVAVLSNPDSPGTIEEVERMRQAAPGLGLELAVFPTRANDIDAKLAAIASSSAQGLVVIDDPFFDSLATRLGVFTKEHALPAITGLRSNVQQGLLMSYSADFRATRRRCASYIARILKGARPADLPVEQTTEFTFLINMRTANALGLTIPQSLLLRADEVIQ